ncbi:hypothetical protein K435DRAFT_961259 [Dendrothele bispora CBS 962.96]|uniref:Sucraseferredoxin-like protein n=1 Tax=Dendrothele bispora (strain CBS 962.96) TaxID=1314807 RepID=A0A4S8MRF1_DENBC|nr:hypothetical protein K435DRAFT_961259 [Dendrothele bispora CBS 962.96]
MHSLRRLKASLLGQDTSIESITAHLDQTGVPISDADCRTCPNPCDQGHESYPTRFNVDMESLMLGSVRPYHRQIIISTGKTDWDREVTDTSGSLAHYVQKAVDGAKHGTSAHDTKPRRGSISSPGVFNSSESTKISILNGSHRSLSESSDLETVLVFPDYKLITEVSRSSEGAQKLWDTCLDPSIAREGSVVEKSPFNTWIIPYSCVILLCSHKRRDNRCSIAAAKLGQAFTHELESRGWQVDTEIENPLHSMGMPLEEYQGTEEEQQENVLKQLQELATEKKALIVRNSHMGGHRYAGNCIIYTPQGSGVWYGRVSTHEVESIVTNTLEQGLILPSLLRGGVNISRPGCKSLLDW